MKIDKVNVHKGALGKLLVTVYAGGRLVAIETFKRFSDLRWYMYSEGNVPTVKLYGLTALDILRLEGIEEG